MSPRGHVATCGFLNRVLLLVPRGWRPRMLLKPLDTQDSLNNEGPCRQMAVLFCHSEEAPYSEEEKPCSETQHAAKDTGTCLF